MRYPYECDEHGEFEVEAPMKDGPPNEVACPNCGGEAQRIYSTQPEIWHTDGSSRDYFSRNPGRGQSFDKKENLNRNWSRYYGEAPPKEDSAGTYDGIPRR